MSYDFAFIKGENFVNIYMDGESHTIDSSHPNYEIILEAIKENDAGKIRKNLTVKSSIENRGNGIVIEGDRLYLHGEEVHGTLAARILDMFNEGFDTKPLERFMANLNENPSRRAVNELYDFLESGKMPITDDGHFLAYKVVREDYTDIFSGTYSNRIGDVVEMPRNHVDDERHRTCSAGLHFCSRGYLPYYGVSPGNRVVIVKINPRDVVSIPSDYNYTKGRTCRYVVVDEHKGSRDQEWFDRSVYEFEDEEEPEDEMGLVEFCSLLSSQEDTIIILYERMYFPGGHLAEFRDADDDQTKGFLNFFYSPTLDDLSSLSDDPVVVFNNFFYQTFNMEETPNYNDIETIIKNIYGQ